ncbi:MAG TPA: dTDP-glucose 4,6-dehydratase [Candidatus Binataceae bacterium]|jgi:dTDP-glucose 4,6-dehydratase|nr:dTDP-glucose 4,6-dehydratase [Candidatus Binataceae bacterium]
MLVTGGAGFIGSNFVRCALRHTEDPVVVFDKLTYAGSLLNLRDAESNQRYAFVKGDICDRAAVKDALERYRPGAIVHFAAETHVDRSIDGPRNFLDANVDGTFELLEAARAYYRTLGDKQDSFRFVHVSTDEVYGSLGAQGLFREDTHYAPNSPYAASKAAADHFVRAYHETYGLPTLITNCTNNYGYYQFPEKLVPLMILNAVSGKDLPIYGDGLNVRDWLFVEDHCAALLAILRGGRPGEKYNIGGSSERNNLQMVDAICAALEEELPAAGNADLRASGVASYRQLRVFVPDRPGHDRRYATDVSKLHRELGWQPKCTFEDGIRRTVRWYLSNMDWCSAVQAGRYDRQRLGLTGIQG